MSISVSIREAVRKRANFVCEYCHSSEEGSTGRFTMDYLFPRSLGGTDDETNLRLFNPRLDDWKDHFIWSQDGQRIVALISIGRATLMRLDMNDDRHDDGSIRRARRLWIRGGWHPASQDPQLG